MDFSAVLASFQQIYEVLGPQLDLGILIFSRCLGFFFTAPVTNRKDIPFPVKLGFILMVSVSLIWMTPAPSTSISENLTIFGYLIFLNVFIGLFIGWIGDVIHRTIASAGSIMTAQIGLSSAMLFDPSSRSQVMILDRFFALLATVLYINLGGVFWLLDALVRSINFFPLTKLALPLTQTIDLGYLVTLTGNTIVIAVQLVAPIVVITLAIDIILGIVNRTAQQMPVFQLSFALKPSIGVAVLLATLPIFINTVVNYLNDYSPIFQSSM